MFLNLNKVEHIHFIGIGGISMSALAENFLRKNIKVTGSDGSKNEITEKLESLGAKIHYPQTNFIEDTPDIVCYTDAISEDNIELIEAKKRNLNLIDRASLLGLLMKNYNDSIAISGTHGKTTTTSMLATIFKYSNLDPTIMIGGNLDIIGGNIYFGKDDILLTEACEYKGNILKYHPSCAVVLNIDEDHLDFFKSLAHIENTFIDYIKSLDETSCVIINADEANLENIKRNIPGKCITFGIYQDADFRATNIKYLEDGKIIYTLNHNDNEYNVKLPIMGLHNVINSLAAISTAVYHGIDIDSAIAGIEHYTPVHRRLEFKGEKNGVTIIDDYAHHPTEIMATLSALRNSVKGRLICVFQPHTFTRTKILLNSFAEAFKSADEVVILDIYASREKDLKEVHARDLVEKISQIGNKCFYYPDFESALNFLEGFTKKDDLVVTMGAGNIYQLGEMFLKK